MSASLPGLLATPLRAGFAQTPAPAQGQAQNGQAQAQAQDGQPFSFERLVERARQKAATAYEEQPRAAEWFSNLSAEQWRSIRFSPDQALWGDWDSYRLQFIPPGGVYRSLVRINIVEEGMAREVKPVPAMFELGDLEPPANLAEILGFAGFRVHYPLNAPGVLDQLLVFLGASYFRAIGRGTTYGPSARGLALNTGNPRPEEIPAFREFWIQRPRQAHDPLTVFALLDSPSVCGAYRFDVATREHTRIDVDANLFFRSAVEQVGIAPLTSMYAFGENDRLDVDDHRPQVHNSGGLSMWRSNGDVLWRPLVNPSELRLTVLSDENPRGFGLLQRDRRYEQYEDIDNRYEMRPNLWVEPKGTWGKGSVRLIEIPTHDEKNDNIVAFWTPEEPVTEGQELRLAYGLLWSFAPPIDTGLARVRATRIGAAASGPDGEASPIRRVVVDFDMPSAELPEGEVRADVTAGNAQLSPTVPRHNPVTGGWRVMFDVEPTGRGPVELRCFLAIGDRKISEVWLYRLDKS
ncbi:glucan biosynthesis protein [Geminicoccaceae bacterium 1502E]|nr:glucan biosynthesis protein [Geminicoccaceae bacterium 1502E]